MGNKHTKEDLKEMQSWSLEQKKGIRLHRCEILIDKIKIIT